MRTILIIDEGATIENVLSEALGIRYQITCQTSQSQILISVEKERPQLILLNSSSQKLVDMVCKLKTMSEIIKETPVVILEKDDKKLDKISRNKIRPYDTIALPMDYFAFCEKIDEIFIRLLGMIDGITGCYKKACIEEKIRDRLSHKRRGTLFLINIDSMSFVSNSVSLSDLQLCVFAIRHLLGDKVLLGINGVTVIGYIAGEEAKNDVSETMNNIIKAIQESIGEKTVYTSIGIALASEYDYSYDDLYVDCDRALGLCRSSGKNCCRFYRR